MNNIRQKIISRNLTLQGIVAGTHINFGYEYLPLITKKRNITPTPRSIKLILHLRSSLFATEVHRNDIYLGPYKFFPVKEPLEFTPGFTERQNYVEVL